jgi:uncharacterized protein (DUF608 family)
MPVGGIGTGQLFLCGDGTLGAWEIFNEHEFVGSGQCNYARRGIRKPVAHGIAVHWEREGEAQARLLDSSGFPDVAFRGEYPVGIVTYGDPALPLRVRIEAFSPFIPLNAKDSALPATVMEVTVENTSREPLHVSVLSWLENPVARKAAADGLSARRITKVVRQAEATTILHSAESTIEPEPGLVERETIVFADFEGGDFGGWAGEGAAVGDGPSTGTLPNQQAVSGFEGTGFVNTFAGGDRSEGTMLSPEFTVSRRYINFLLGGGEKPGRVGMRLLVDGKPVLSATGRDSEKLRWCPWDVSAYERAKARLEIFDKDRGSWGHVLVDHVEFSDRRRRDPDDLHFDEYPDAGTLAWACVGGTVSPEDAQRRTASLEISREVKVGFADWQSETAGERRATALATKPVGLAPGKSHSFLFVLAWHFPNTVKPDRAAGHEYAARFADAGAVARYVIANRERLTGETRFWRDTWYDSTLPVWLLDRIHLTACCLATGTCQWWQNGRFWAWEGVVCCEGTCTHVWNYAQSLARLFPELERSVRERQDFGVGLMPDGLVGFRHNGAYAADGQCGTILKAWREHLMSPDDAFLRRNWPAIRRALDYAIAQDANADGMIENRQHNTYDIDFYGANTFVGALYLAALRAGEEMAGEMGDGEYAARLRAIFESGRRLGEELLWNGEYFVQKVDLTKYPHDQYGDGCLSDQLFGQNWAHQAGLGYLYAPEKVRLALESVWKYNWAPRVGDYNRLHSPERPFADAAEAGLLICTWPRGVYLKEGMRYREEVWTGIEYEVAANMIWEGMVEEGLATCRAVHDRYHPSKRNPFNEVECSDFYARAMASWGVLLALSGFAYHGPHGHLAFAPRFKAGDFRCAFIAAEGWGSFSQRAADGKCAWKIEVRHGQLSLSALELELPPGVAGAKPGVSLASQRVAATTRIEGRKLRIGFAERLVIGSGMTLSVDL